jgi:hypothetical protein
MHHSGREKIALAVNILSTLSISGAKSLIYGIAVPTVKPKQVKGMANTQQKSAAKSLDFTG